MAKTTTKESTKVQLLEAGTEIMLEKGYNNTGIMEVLQSTGVPKGSFYYYFDSKEDFGLQIINHHDATYTERLKVLLDETKSPVSLLRSFCEDNMRNFEQNACRKGCLIGNLSQEMADQSEVFRNRLQEVMLSQRNIFATCIENAQQKGEISQKIDANALAEFFQCGWSGAVMRAKTMKVVEPMKVFISLMFDHVLKCGQ